MQQHKGYGLIEVLVSVSIFLIIMTSTGNFIGKLLLQAQQVEKMHIVLHSVQELNEQLHMLPKYNSDEKRELINAWVEIFKQRVPEYCVAITETVVTKQLHTIQVTINKPHSQLAITITA